MFLYILKNTQGMTYVGVSRYPLVRLKQHNSAARSLQRHYTNRNRPWTIAAVFNGFSTRAQALRAEYMIKHQPQKIRDSVAIVARIATAQATCNHLLTQVQWCQSLGGGHLGTRSLSDRSVLD